eukprot:gene9948-20684_t
MLISSLSRIVKNAFAIFLSILVLCIISKNAITHEISALNWEEYRVPKIRHYENLPYFQLNQVSGRSGNQWIQFVHAFNFAICCRGLLVITPDFEHFPLLSKYFNFSTFESGMSCNNTIHISGSFFQLSHINIPYPKCRFDQYNVLQLYVFNNSNPYGVQRSDQNCPNDIEDTLVVQIRSGDIFLKYPPSIHYIQPPISYYKNIINDFQFQKVIFLTSPEPILSPVWSYLQNYTSRIEFQNRTFIFQNSSNFNVDFNIYMCARHFVGAHSSLSSLLTEASNVMKTYFHYIADTQRYPVNYGIYSNVKALAAVLRRKYVLNIKIRKL